MNAAKKTIGCALALLGLFILVVMLLAPERLVFSLLLGWIPFLIRNVSKFEGSHELATMGFACLILFTLGFHWFARWLVQASLGKVGSTASLVWSFKHSAGVSAVCILLFAVGTASIAIVHQIGWLATSKERLFINNRQEFHLIAMERKLGDVAEAVEKYEVRIGSIPRAPVVDRSGRLLHGWQAVLLPYLELPELYQMIDFDKPWSHASNRRAFEHSVFAFQNEYYQSHDREGYALSHVAGNVRLFQMDRASKRAEIPDGAANTILAGEAFDNFLPWGHPVNLRDPARGINQSGDGFGNSRQRGVAFVMADGSVRVIKEDVDPKILRALATPAGGEATPMDSP